MVGVNKIKCTDVEKYINSFILKNKVFHIIILAWFWNKKTH